MADITTVETAARVYAEDIRRLCEAIGRRDDELQAVSDKREQGIKSLIKACGMSHRDLHRYIAESQHLFDSPKTQTFDIIRVGFMKQKGSILHDDENVVAGRIKRFLPEKYEELTRSKVTLSKDALRNLPDNELEIIGVRFVEGESVATIKIIQPEISKILKQIEKELSDEWMLACG